MDLIPEQLAQARFKVLVAALELPAEMLLQVGVGGPDGHPFLESEYIGVAVRGRIRMADKSADVVEERLRPLPFAKLAVKPLGDKLLRAQLGLTGRSVWHGRVWIHVQPHLHGWISLPQLDGLEAFGVV